MPDTRYLKQRRGARRSGMRWYVRVTVPSDLQPVLGARIIERSLDTSDVQEAKTRRHAELAKIFESFERARRGTITDADIEQEAQRYLLEEIAAIQRNPGDIFEGGGDGEAVLWNLQDNLAGQDWPKHILHEAEQIERKYGATLSGERKTELCRALLKAEIEALSRVLGARDGDIPSRPPVLHPKAIDPVAGKVRVPESLGPRQGKGLRVEAATEAYLSGQTWTGQTRGQAKATLRFFKEFTRDAPLETITRKDVAAFLTALARLDPNYGRRSAHEDLKFRELLQKHPGTLSARTLKRHAAVIAGMFDHAIKSGKFEGANPARGHSHKKPEKRDNRRPFKIDELNKLLHGPADTTLRWLILIALFSGMRLDEICGLRVADVRTEGKILFFDLRSHPGRRVKTAAAQRQVPVHSELLQAGLNRYVAKIANGGHEYLFPALKPGGPDKKRSWYISKRFTAYRRSVGVDAADTVFHCFRKNAATALERAQIPENEAVQVLGHKKLLSLSYGLYSGGLDLPGLRRVIEAIRYQGLDLSRRTLKETRLT